MDMRRARIGDGVGLAPDPARHPQAIVQVYAARCARWLGWFGVHPGVAVKPAGANAYTVYEVIDWRLRLRGSAAAIRRRTPGARWAAPTRRPPSPRAGA